MLLGSALAIHLTVWAVALYVEPTHIPQLQLIAERFSTFAILFMSMNLILSTRARVLERSLKGLDKLFVTHRTIGLSVAVLITSHFLLVPKSVGFVWSKPFGYAALALLLMAILIASAPRFPWHALVPIKYQTWKFSHRFMGTLVALAVTHSLLGNTYVKTSPLLAAYVYGVAVLGLAAWLYRELGFRYFGPFSVHEVATSRLLDGDVSEVTLTSGSAPPARTAGQFAFVSFAGGPTREQHPFTISSGARSDIRFSIKASGDYTEALLRGAPIGSSATVEGPYGAFDYRRGRRRQLWLAGGIGITPFLSMAEDLDAETDVLLVWSVHDERDAVYREQLSHLCDERANLRLIVHVTSQRGRLEVGGVGLVGQPADYSVFICGPLPMRRAMVKQARSLGVARSEIHFEEFRLR